MAATRARAALRLVLAQLEPPGFEDRDRQRRAAVLQFGLLLAAALTLALGSTTSLLYPEGAPQLAAGSVYAVVFVCSLLGLWLLRRGKLDAVAIGLPTVLWLTLTIAATWVGGLRGAGVFMYPAIVLIAGFLVSVRAALVFALLCSLSALGLGLAGDQGLLPEAAPVPMLRLWLTLSTSILSAAAVVWLVLGSLESALREAEGSERRFERLFQGAPDGIVSLGPAGRIESINAAAETLLRVHASDATGQRLTELLPRPAPGTPSLADAISREARGPLLAHLSPAGGSSIWVEVNSRTHTGEAGAQQVELTLRDVTDRVSAEAERRDLEGQLAEGRHLESVGRLAGGIAHDFNNLLTVIQINSELLAEQEEAPELRERSREIHDAAGYAATLTRQLLAFASRQVLEPEWIDLNEVVLEISPILRRVIGEGVRFSVDLATDLGSIRADPSQLQQVMINLVTNARDALPDGGLIQIETARAGAGEPPGAPGPAESSIGWVRLQVRDTGIGMDEETLASAFEPFFSRKETGRGTGLGLASVYGIVRQSGGYVDVKSDVGRGSVFSVYLPEYTQRPAPAAHAPTPPPEPASSETVLLVEDDASVRDVITRMLENAGYRVLAAGSADDALATLAQHGCPIDLLLTDVVMPGLSGPRLAEQLTHQQPDLKVVFMSGHTEDSALSAKARERGALFIAKPPSKHEMLTKLRQALDPQVVCSGARTAS